MGAESSSGHIFSSVDDDIVLDELPALDEVVVAEKAYVRLEVVHAQNWTLAPGGESVGKISEPQEFYIQTRG